MKDKAQVFGAPAVAGAAFLGGCVTPTQEITPAASLPTVVVTQPVQRMITYPEGRYELRGAGTATSPYYWVWIPTGVMVPAPPLPPAMVR